MSGNFVNAQGEIVTGYFLVNDVPVMQSVGIVELFREVLRDFESRGFAEVNRFEFFLGGQPVKTGKVDFFDQFVVVFGLLDEFGDFAVGSIDGVADGHAVDHVEGVGEGDVEGAFAFTGAEQPSRHKPRRK